MSTNWKAVKRMIEGFGHVSKEHARIVYDLLQRSSLSFAHFEDPLLVDFGVHRWLSGLERKLTQTG